MASRKYEKLKTQKNRLIEGIAEDASKFHLIADEAERVSEVSKNAAIIIRDLDRQFEQATKLNGRDVSFLFFATALQCIRQYVLTPFQERTLDKESAKAAHEDEAVIFGTMFGAEDLDGKTKRYYASLEDIIHQGVPYDTQFGSGDFQLKLSGKAHRFRTLGHDPLLGWIFGTSNILTNTLTDWNFQSYHIKPQLMSNGAEKNKIVQHADTVLMLKKVTERTKKEPQALAAAVIKQGLHIKSDQYSVAGLPIPMLSTLSPETSQAFAEHGIDFGNALTIGKQAAFSIFINTLIAAIHSLYYDPSFGSQKLYEVKTRKILSYSNLIASVSNIIAVALAEAIAAATGNTKLGKDAARYLDIGGIAVTLYRIVKDKAFVKQIKQEFLEQEFYDLVVNSEYSI